MKTLKKKKNYSASPEIVFHYLDDLGVTGMHMTKPSMMMMGSKLNLQYLSKNKKGFGTKYRWTGKMIGMNMDFTVEVTKWIPGMEKTWETIGPSKLIIYSWYRMHLDIFKSTSGALAELSISYEKPEGFFLKILSFLFADLYCKWCLNKMLKDTQKALRENITPEIIYRNEQFIKLK